LFLTAVVKADVNETYEGKVSAGEIRYFEFPITEEGIVLEFEVTIGNATLYGSYTNSNPNKTWHNYEISKYKEYKVTQFIHFSDEVKQQKGSTKVFYCSVVLTIL